MPSTSSERTLRSWLCFLLLGGGLLSGSPRLAGGQGAAPPDSCGLPTTWNQDEIATQAWPPGAGRAFILAWDVIEDERTPPLRVERCLVLKPHGDGGYVLTNLYRRPLEADAEWRAGMTHVSPRHGSHELGLMLRHAELFKHRPTNQEIYASFAETRVNWSFGLDRGWKRLGAGVCEAAWFEAIGEKPTRFYPR